MERESGCYVTKVGKGQKYWFLTVSVPIDWLRLELSYEEFARQPGQLHRIFARAFNEAFRGASCAERSVPSGTNPFDSVRGDGE